MKFKDNEWLTDYVNAIHFSVRLLERQGRPQKALRTLRDQTDALIHDAILANVPLEVFSIQRMVARVKAASASHYQSLTDGKQHSDLPAQSETDGDLLADFRFLCQGFAEFSLQEIIDEAYYYLAKVYPEITDIRSTVQSLFQQDLAAGQIEKLGPSRYRHIAFS